MYLVFSLVFRSMWPNTSQILWIINVYQIEHSENSRLFCDLINIFPHTNTDYEEEEK